MLRGSTFAVVLVLALADTLVALAQDRLAQDGPGRAGAPDTQAARNARTSPPSAGARRPGDNARRQQSGNLIGHGGPVKAIASDAATGRVATGSFDYSLMIWDVRSAQPKLLRRIAAFEGAVNAVAFLPDGNRIVAGGDGGDVWLWQLDREKPVARLKGHAAKINAISVSPNGRHAVSASWDRTARIWNLDTGKAGPVLAGHKGPVNAAIFSADGRYVYTAGYNGAIIAWRAADGTRLKTIHSHGWGVNVLALAPGSGPPRLIYGALNGDVGVIDPEAGRQMAKLPSHERPVLAIATAAKPGLIATGSGDGTIRVVRSGDWAPVEEFENSFGPVWALAFVAHGTALYYGGLDDFALRWQIAPRAPFEPVASKFPRRFQVSDTASLGERQFARKCSVCHTLGPDDRNRAGPTLHNLFERKAGSLADYPYSDALKRANIVWTEETVGKLFELGPEHYTPGSKMPLQKITDRATRAALIAYLKSATTGIATAKPNAEPKRGPQQ